MSRLHILFIARRYPPSVGGMERFAYDLSHELEHDVQLTRITWGGSNKWLPIVLPWFFVKAVAILLIHRDIGLIHMQDGVQAPIGWLLSKLFHRPYVVQIHGLDVNYKLPLYQKAVVPFIRRAGAVIAISEATAEEARKRAVPEKKLSIIPLGMHDDYGTVTRDRPGLLKALGLTEDRPLLLTTGRLVKRKGVAWFIESALPLIVKDKPDVLYIVAGVGDEQAAIEAAMTKSNMVANVRLLGRVSDEFRSQLYQSSDVFVMPNIVVSGDMEGFGIVVHEAASAELPVVASKLEGIVDALADGQNGIFVPTRDGAGFAREILKLLGDETYRQKFGQKARTYTLNTYSWPAIADRYVAIYQHLAGTSAQGAVHSK